MTTPGLTSMTSDQAWAELMRIGGRPEQTAENSLELIMLLNDRAEPQTVEWAVAALTDPEPGRRRFAAQLLGFLASPDTAQFASVAVPALAAAAQQERDTETRRDLVEAIGRSQDRAWAVHLLVHATDSSPDVRKAVAAGIPNIFDYQPMSRAALDTLIALSHDDSPAVRDWASFSLGQSDQDDDTIRAALAARLTDEIGDDARFEAAVGLARRGDRRPLPFVAGRLLGDPDDVYLLDLHAAAELADRDLLPALYRLRDAWIGEQDEHTTALDLAIRACESGRGLTPVS